MKNREKLAENGYEEVIVFENPDFDSAIIGVTTDNRVVYDLNKMIEHLSEADGIDAIDAMDFIDYNTLRACPYVDGAPIVIETWIEEL